MQQKRYIKKSAVIIYVIDVCLVQDWDSNYVFFVGVYAPSHLNNTYSAGKSVIMYQKMQVNHAHHLGTASEKRHWTTLIGMLWKTDNLVANQVEKTTEIKSNTMLKLSTVSFL